MVTRMGTRVESLASIDSSGSGQSIEFLDDNHIDQLDEPPVASRMGVMAAFSSFDEFTKYALILFLRAEILNTNL